MWKRTSIRALLAAALGAGFLVFAGGASAQTSPSYQGPGCFPRCRTGFACVQDQSVPACGGSGPCPALGAPAVATPSNAPVLEAAPAPFSPLPAAPRLDTAQPPIDFTLEDAERARFNGGPFGCEIAVFWVGGAGAGDTTYKSQFNRE